MNNIGLNQDEKATIRALKRIASRWPSSLWLFSASGRLCVMKKDDNNEIVMTSAGGVDPSRIVCNIEIENDGGDW